MAPALSEDWRRVCTCQGNPFWSFTMTVPARNILIALAAFAAPNVALADTRCCAGSAPPAGPTGVVIPAPPTLTLNTNAPRPAGHVFVAPPTYGGPSACSGCNSGGDNGGGAGGGGVGIGGGSVIVTGPVVTGPTIVTPTVTVPAPSVVVNAATPSAPFHMSFNGGYTSNTGGMIVFGGSGGYAGGFGGGEIGGGGFNLATADSGAMQAETRTVERAAALPAFCLDDRGTPHPASQTFGEKAVNKAYRGEIYRCMAGTKMRVQVGKVEAGTAKFEGAQTMECAKNEALAFDGERIACHTQIAKRHCNERSLLRRFGPGLKFLTIKTTETFASQRQVTTTNANNVVCMQFDGGVGGGW
jgi:hypothetical protein